MCQTPGLEESSDFKGQASGGDYYYRSGYSGDYLCVPADSVREERVGDSLTGTGDFLPNFDEMIVFSSTSLYNPVFDT